MASLRASVASRGERPRGEVLLTQELEDGGAFVVEQKLEEERKMKQEEDDVQSFTMFTVQELRNMFLLRADGGTFLWGKAGATLRLAFVLGGDEYASLAG